MGSTWDIFREHGWRALLVVPCFGIAGYFFLTSDPLLGLLCAAPFLIGAGIIIAPLFTTWLAEPFRALFYPTQRFDRPQPMYSIPQSKRSKGLY